MRKMIVAVIITLLLSNMAFALPSGKNHPDSLDRDLLQLAQLRNQQKQAQTAQGIPQLNASARSQRTTTNLPDQPRLQSNSAFPSPATPSVAKQSVSTHPLTMATPKQERVYGEDSLRQSAFENVIREKMPLSPEEIVKFRKYYQESELAANTLPQSPPKPVATSQFVNLSPGSTPPTIRLSQGFVSSLIFLDSAGNPWPIAAYDLGNPVAFNIQWDKKSNALMVQAQQLYTYGNLAVRLQGLNTPVMLTLVPGQRAIDYRVDLRVQGYGPNTTHIPRGQHTPTAEDSVLLSVLDGVPPPNSVQLSVSGNYSSEKMGNIEYAQAWAKNNTLYLRTRLPVISPGWVSTMSSADGMRVYQMQRVPLVLVLQDGKLAELKIEGWE